MSTSIPSAIASTAEPCTPSIPSELVYIILEHLWEETHTLHSRATLLKNIVLVNRTWLALSARIASRDAHPSCHHNPITFLRLIAQPDSSGEPCDLFSAELNRVATQSCRSLTFEVNRRPKWPCVDDERSIGVGLALRLASVPHSIPNLRHISLLHTGWYYNHIFQHIRFWGIPPQVTHLSLAYAFTDVSKDMLMVRGFDITDALTWIYKPSLAPHRRTAYTPGLRHLALSGVPKAFTVLMLKHVCPDVETLELTHPAAGQLPALAPLPPATRTLVLRYPVVALCYTQMEAWGLPEALERGLFPGPPSGADVSNNNLELKLKPARIVLRLGTRSRMAFDKLRHECNRFDVELVYELEDSWDRVVPGARDDLQCTCEDPSPEALERIRGWMQ
ncbi:hypothetical protein V8D89_006674 [Ganoderma adspersum]